LIYRPSNERLWDSWIVPHDGRFYLFYIRVSAKGTRWDGISLAISDDLLHWQEYGPVFEKHPEAIWLGTGMVQRIGERFIMNFSEERPAGTQYISFAESANLIDWSRLEHIHLKPDPAYYIADPLDSCEELPRWDSLGIVDALEDQGPPYNAFLTAHGANRVHKGKSGVLGMLTSEDGLLWHALPPVTDAELYPNFEVPEHLSLNGRHYVIFSTVSLHGPRYDERSLDFSGGTYYVVGDELEGPYRMPPGDPMLLGVRNHHNVVMAYVGRVIRHQDGYLLYHIWGDHTSNGRIGIPKIVKEIAPWQLGLYYWEGCEALKGAELISAMSEEKLVSLRKVGHLPSVTWSAVNEGVRFSGLGGVDAVEWLFDNGGIQSSDTINDLRNGRIVEFTLSVESGLGAGIWLGEQKRCLFFNVKAGRVEFGSLLNGWMASQVLDIDLFQHWDFAYGETVKVRVLARNECIEAFINDRHALCYRLTDTLIPSRIGFFAEDADGSFGGIKMWQMQ
jgi:hypothetical protein